jgi:hypothetical protein
MNIKKKIIESKNGSVLALHSLLSKDSDKKKDYDILEKKEEFSSSLQKKSEQTTTPVLHPIVTRPTKVKSLSIKIPEKNKELENRMKVKFIH